jgi:hypothetical protein
MTVNTSQPAAQWMSKRGRAVAFVAEGQAVAASTIVSSQSDDILLRNFRCFDSIINTLHTRKAPILIDA